MPNFSTDFPPDVEHAIEYVKQMGAMQTPKTGYTLSTDVKCNVLAKTLINFIEATLLEINTLKTQLTTLESKVLEGGKPNANADTMGSNEGREVLDSGPVG